MNANIMKTISKANLDEVRAQEDEDIDLSDIPEATEADFARARWIGPLITGPYSVRVFRTDPETGEEITVSITEHSGPKRA